MNSESVLPKFAATLFPSRSMSYQGIAKKLLSGGIVILDGGIGTEVTRRGVRWRQHGIEELTDYANAGADIFLLETFNSTSEAEVALRAAKEVGKPAWIAFVPSFLSEIPHIFSTIQNTLAKKLF